jgi:hypothetical protein
VTSYIDVNPEICTDNSRPGDSYNCR